MTSYVIARTLGVVDDVKASTSDVDMTADEHARLTNADPRTGAGVGVGIDVGVAVPVSARIVPSAFSSDGPARSSESLLAPEDSCEGQMPGDERDRHGSRDVGRGSEGAVCTSAQALRRRGQMEMETQAQTQTSVETESASKQVYHFAAEDGLWLAGEGVLSPAVSGPPSPLTPRMTLSTLTESDGRGSGHASEEEGVMLRRRVQGTRENDLVHT